MQTQSWSTWLELKANLMVRRHYNALVKIQRLLQILWSGASLENSVTSSRVFEMLHLLHNLHHLEVLPLADGVTLLDDHEVTIVTFLVLIMGKELLTLTNIL